MTDLGVRVSVVRVVVGSLERPDDSLCGAEELRQRCGRCQLCECCPGQGDSIRLEQKEWSIVGWKHAAKCVCGAERVQSLGSQPFPAQRSSLHWESNITGPVSSLTD